MSLIENFEKLMLLESADDFKIFCLNFLDFVFHNKMPKCGGSTMNAILTVLSDWHKYRFLRLDPALAKFYQGKRMAKVINKIKQKVQSDTTIR